ncbi:MAG: DUF3306 domain-containing protein [Hyphomicrobiales bacterium]
MAEDDDFLSRWARRKAQSRSGQKPERPDAADAGTAVRPGEAPRAAAEGGQVALREPPGGAQEGDAPPGMTPEEAEEAYRDFDFDALDARSDYKQFMKQGVPEWARQKALRKLWTSDPVFANLDGLVDYGEDFTDAALAVKELVTSWKPGQGYRTDEEIQREREEYGPEEQRIAARKEREAREAAGARARDAETGEGEDAGEAAAGAAPPAEAAPDTAEKAPDHDPPRRA